MWLYFDKNGTLKQQFQYYGPAFRTGATDGEIFAVFEDMDEAALADITVFLQLLKPVSGRIDTIYAYYPIEMVIATEVFDTSNFDTVPENISPFVNGRSYTGVRFLFNQTFNNDFLILLDTPGIWCAVISLFKPNGAISVQGRANFNVQNNGYSQDETVLPEEWTNAQIFSAIAKKLSIKSSGYIKIVDLNDIDDFVMDETRFNAGDIVFNIGDKKFYQIVNNALALIELGYEGGGGSGDANVLSTEIKNIFLEYDKGYDTKRLRPGVLFESYANFDENSELVYGATQIASHSYVRFITTEIDSKFEQAIVNNKAVIRLDYPIRKSQNYKDEIGYRGYADSLQIKGSGGESAVAYINNNLIFITEDDVKTDNNGNKYIDKRISVLSLLQKMTDDYSPDDEGIIKRFIELNNEDIPSALVAETRAFGGQWNNFPDNPALGCKSNIGKPYTNGLKSEHSSSDGSLVGHTQYYRVSTEGYKGGATLTIAGENKIKTYSTKYINMIPVKCDDIELIDDASELEGVDRPHFSDHYRRLDTGDSPSSTWFYLYKNSISLGDDSVVKIYGISANAKNCGHSKWFTSLVTRPRLALLKDGWSDNPDDNTVSIWKKLYPQSLQQIFFYMPTVLSMNNALIGLMKVQITHKP